jgi:hypothetical protein
MSGFSSSSFVLGAICGVFLAGVWFSLGATLPFSKTSLPEVQAELPGESTATNVLMVEDQPAGDSVVIESLSVSHGVWVAVREMNGRDFGNVLGAIHVQGPQGVFSIPLLRATEPKRSYVVQLYRNDNNGNYDPAVNSVYVDFETGKRVVEFFTTE